MILEYLKISLRNIKRRKLRSGLTIVGIFIAIATIFVLVSLSLGLQGTIEEQFRLFGTDKFFVQAKGQAGGPGTPGSVQLTKEDVNVIDSVSGVKDWTYYAATASKVEFKDEIRYTNTVGVPTDRGEVFTESGFWKVETGRFLRSGDRGLIGIGSQYANNNYLGEPIELGDNILINDRPFRVKAIMKSVGSPPDDRLIIMPLEDFRELFPEVGERIDQITVQVDESEDIKEVASKVEKRLRSFREVTEKTQDFTILTPDALLASFGVILNVLTSFLLGVAAITLLVGGIGIANTMYTSVLERTREIGVMKAVGARNKDVLLLFTVEAGLLGLVGGIGGVLLGMLIGKTIEYIATVKLATSLVAVAFPIYLIVGCLLFAFVVGSVSGLLPAYRASRIRPVEALRYE
ncbi:ABC transporter permease [Candidatus Pacearchaeota archaeon]|nr:ABC transporter permease [Candidatus Pacearchaeota archaeon]